MSELNQDVQDIQAALDIPSGLTTWELDFVEDLYEKSERFDSSMFFLSSNQRAKLTEILTRLGK